MARKKKAADLVDEQIKKASEKPKEKMLYCGECGGILFGGQLIHRMSCSQAPKR